MSLSFNDTFTEYPRNHTVQGRFREIARRDPDAPAVEFVDGRLTYGELDERSERLSHHLRALGVGPETVAGLCLESSCEMIVAILAVLKAGGAYLSLDLSYPPERRRLMLDDSRAVVLLTRGDAADDLGEIDATLVRLDEIPETALAAFDSAAPLPDTHARHLALILYTSGSTGRPKGVAAVHRGILRLVVSNRYFEFGPSNRMSQVANLSFDAATWEIWGALLNGGCLVGIDRQTSLSPPALARALRERKITVSVLTTALFHQVAQEIPDAFAELECLVYGGEAADPARNREVVRHGRPEYLINGYGPAECTTIATTYRVLDVADDATSLPIGKPLGNTRVHLFDPELRPVADGEVGDIFLGGDGLARGYLGQPAKTAWAFVPDPTGPSGERLYRTGDRARVGGPDGLEFEGRADDQVKIRGIRIEPREVEVVLSAHPDLALVAVIARREPTGLRLVAYCTATDGATIDVEAVKASLAEKVPAHLVPGAFVVLDSLPLTANGKIDRQALAAIDPAELRRRDTVSEAPRTAFEQLVAGIWREVLGAYEIGRHDDFFELGGHSLAAGRVIGRIRQTMARELSPLVIFEAPTVAELAQKLEQASGGLPPIERADRNRPLPLSLPQERVFFLNELSPGSRAYNVQSSIRFAGPLQPAALERAIREVFRRHEIFRTTFRRTAEGQPVQEIHAEHVPVFPRIDLTGLPAERREPESERLVRLWIDRSFDASKLPLVCWGLAQLDDEDHLLLHVEHHFVHDGWSFGLLVGEIRDLYEAYAAGRPSPLGELPIQFADFATWQRNLLQGPVLDDLLGYWRRQLPDDPGLLPLPTDRPRPARPSHRGALYAFDLPKDLYEGVRQAGRDHGATLFMTTMATFLVLLHRYTGQEAFCVGTGIANRRQRETETLIGMMVNTLPLYTELDGEPTFRELLHRVRETTLQAYVHQDLPFEKLVQELRPQRDGSYSPLFQVMFAFHDAEVPDMNFGDVEGKLTYRHNGSSKFDMNIILVPRTEQRTNQAVGDDDQLRVLWEYSTDLFDVETIERMTGHYQNLLRAVVENADRPIAELPMLGTDEERQLLAHWQVPERQMTEEPGLVARILEQCRARADEPALESAEAQLTYGELDRRSRALAERLVAAGVGPESRVGVLLGRSPHLVVAQLAVLRAGGAFLPLDPSLPGARLELMLKDAEARVVITTRERAGSMARQLSIASSVLPIDDAATFAAQPPLVPLPEARPESLAYLIYTSGSTGRPKAVAVPHGALCNLVDWHLRAFEVTAGDRCTQLARVSFDASVWEVWPTLAAGATLCFPDDETLAASDSLRSWLVQQKVDLTFLPTPLAEALLELPDPPRGLPRQILTGGDELRRRPPAGFPSRLINNYGPTENAVVALSGPVESEGNGRPDLGRAIDGVGAAVTDSRLRPVAVGLPGELCLAGTSLARGYLGRPALTAERFVPNPAASEPGARLYRTGDLVRRLADGRLEFLGRIDRQVQLRGLRIELGEIESILRAQPGVSEVAVVLHRPEDEAAQGQLVAFVVGKAAEADLRTALRRQVPEYMVPGSFVREESLPLNSSGKVDRKALMERALPASEPKKRTPPGNATEKAVAEIWRGVLPVEEIGRDDSFFDLGGHSMLLAQVKLQLQQDLGHDVRIVDLIEHPDLRGLARYLDRLGESIATPESDDRSRQKAELGRNRLMRQRRKARATVEAR